jgi:hypothetical protein
MGANTKGSKRVVTISAQDAKEGVHLNVCEHPAPAVIPAGSLDPGSMSLPITVDMING